MEQQAATDQNVTAGQAGTGSVPRLRVEQEDVGNLDKVLRGYYLGQIKQIDGRRDRLKARKLIENHLVLPKSRQRTSKDAAYIREVLDMDSQLLAQLEESRLIRRLNQSGHNPIYEISHDTLVEPILAERHNREAVMLFLRRYGRWFFLLLLLLFAFGMFFENWFDIVDDSLAFRTPTKEDVHLQASDDILARRGTHAQTLVVPFPEIKDYRKTDSLTLYIGVNVTAHPGLDQHAGQDTIALNLGALPLMLPRAELQRLLESGRDTAIPLRTMVPIGAGSGEDGLLADVAGMTLLRLQNDGQTRGGDNLPSGAVQRTRGSEMIEANFGRRTINPGGRTTTVNLDTLVNLADMVPDDPLAQNLLKGKTLRLTYRVDVSPAPAPDKQIEYVPVSGIEVQYSDGTRRFIPGSPGAQEQAVYHTVQPGETLYKISRQYGVSSTQLREINQLPDNNIKVGQTLRIR